MKRVARAGFTVSLAAAANACADAKASGMTEPDSAVPSPGLVVSNAIAFNRSAGISSVASSSQYEDSWMPTIAYVSADGDAIHTVIKDAFNPSWR